MGRVPTRDGYICIAGVDEKRWPSFCKIVGIQHLEKDPEYSDNVVRNFHGEKIQKVLDEIFPEKTSKEWLKELTDADILATEVVDYRTMLKSEQARINGYLLELDHPMAGKVLVSGTPITINGEVTTTPKPRPSTDSIPRKCCSSSATRGKRSARCATAAPSNEDHGRVTR